MIISTQTSLQNKSSVLPSEQYYAAIDLGSNTCRLLIAKRSGDSFSTQEVHSKIVRLAEGLSQTNRLSPMAIQRTLQIVSQYARRINQYKPIEVYAVATEACRQAENAESFMNLIETQTGISFSVISQKEEAFYVAKGCAALMQDTFPYTIFFDIGGGSTEVIWARKKSDGDVQVIDSTSLPFGVVNIAENFNANLASIYQTFQSEVANRVSNFAQKNHILNEINHKRVQMISTSGTATTVAAIHLGLRAYDRQKVDRTVLTFANIESITKQLQLMSINERVLHPCVGNERGDLILGGMAILGGICEALPVGQLQVADRGVRDGIVAYMAYGHKPAPDHRLHLETSAA
ncbi:Ppx/GppA phosphatase family protein [Candidatus Nucleicultrix amoebiphila]|uniref:Ppx/GppA phosphatase family protein n=1 Tax=Candidatus Nucleicultrix amoebiphila TaxID=1509244 RepID=UPI000A26C317|nr:Ppx/GppA phosphatase family protein [Candidatus Nucleicultrix amoebiphila]